MAKVDFGIDFRCIWESNVSEFGKATMYITWWDEK